MFDVHPMVVHFPIAMLVFYSLFEAIPQRWIARWKSSCTSIKLAFLFLGTITSWLALSTGEVAEERVGETVLVDTHALFANATSWIFSILAVAYLWSAVLRPFLQKKNLPLPRIIDTILNRLTGIILFRPLVIILSLAGLVAITITGALGGAIVYGPDIDPFVSFFYHLLIPTS